MSSNSNYKRHAALVDKMATTLGIDLEQKVMEGQLQMDSLSDAVLSCTGCSDPEGCEHWLEQNTTADHAPGMCRNVDMFEMLKNGKTV